MNNDDQPGPWFAWTIALLILAIPTLIALLAHR